MLNLKATIDMNMYIINGKETLRRFNLYNILNDNTTFWDYFTDNVRELVSDVKSIVLS